MTTSHLTNATRLVRARSEADSVRGKSVYEMSCRLTRTLCAVAVVAAMVAAFLAIRLGTGKSVAHAQVSCGGFAPILASLSRGRAQWGLPDRVRDQATGEKSPPLKRLA